MNTTVHKQISALFCDLFDDPELRRFLRQGESGADLVCELPGPTASLIHIAGVAVEQLHRRGLFSVTLVRLGYDFPGSVNDIRAMLGHHEPLADATPRTWRPSGLKRATIRAWKTQLAGAHGNARDDYAQHAGLRHTAFSPFA